MAQSSIVHLQYITSNNGQARIIDIDIVVFNDVKPFSGSQNGVLKVCNDNYLYSLISSFSRDFNSSVVNPYDCKIGSTHFHNPDLYLLRLRM
jgi:hypothetical protein